MQVINVGKEGILTEYNGKRFNFVKGVPVEIESAVYNNIIQSGHINAMDIIPYEEKEEKKESSADKIIPKIMKKKGRPKR